MTRYEWIKGSNSKCCHAGVRLGGRGSTHYYVCEDCNNACDIIGENRPSCPTCNHHLVFDRLTKKILCPSHP